jgi:hypothetical protein
MSIKLKALGLGLLAALAIGAVTVMNASAVTGGHFVAEVDNGTLKASETPTHRLEFTVSGFNGSIVCPQGTFNGALTAKTFVGIQLTPLAKENCQTKAGTAGDTPVDFNGCGIELKIGKKAATHNTTDIFCPGGKVIEVTHKNCTIKIPAKAGLKGVVYTNVLEGGKHTITIELTAPAKEEEEVEAYFEGGICTFLGTKHTMRITGSLTERAFDAGGKPVHVTATGSED